MPNQIVIRVGGDDDAIEIASADGASWSPLSGDPDAAASACRLAEVVAAAGGVGDHHLPPGAAAAARAAAELGGRIVRGPEQPEDPPGVVS